MEDKVKMNEIEENECAKDCRDITHDKQLFAERRSSELADEFTRLEVQIATILFAFVGIFLQTFTEKLVELEFSPLAALMMKLAFASTIFSLIASLAFGLIHIKRKEKFWDEFIVQRVNRFVKWEDAVKKKTSFREAQAFFDGSAKGGGPYNLVRSPLWTWILQTICLGFSIAFLLIISLVLIFH